MSTLYFDFETRSKVDLKASGAYRYAEDTSTEAICIGYAFDDEEPKVAPLLNGAPMPQEVIDAVKQGATLCAHNAAFDVLMMEKYVPVDYHQVKDTLHKCSAANLPRSLEKAAAFLGLPHNKDKSGKVLINKLSRPQKDGGWYERTDVLEKMFLYCKQDVEVLRALDKSVPDLLECEQDVAELDFDINTTGMCFDRSFVESAMALADKVKGELDEEMNRVTEGRVRVCSEVARLTLWLNENGIKCDTLKGQKLDELIESAKDERCKRALILRKRFAKTSLAKLSKMLSYACTDGRLRGIFLYHGAGTGRWAGKGPQPQNYPRLKEKKNVILRKLEAIKGGRREELGEDALDEIKSVLRCSIAAGKGKVLVGADLAAIEARGIAWLAGQEDVLEVFRSGQDIYCHAASKIFRANVTEKEDPRRFVGKVATLALGYQGAVGAFQNMSENYGARLKDEEVKDIVKAWRESNQKIVWYWRSLEQAALDAMSNKGVKVPCGPIGRAVTFLYDGFYLTCKLPSGRRLFYPKASVAWKSTPYGKRVRQVTYVGDIDGKGAQKVIEMYGGKWSENVTQAVARDVMVHAMLKLRCKGVEIVAHTHDELVLEVEKGSFTPEDLVKAMTETPPWAKGLPLDAEGWTGERYLKS